LGENFLEKATPHNKGMFLCIEAVMAQYSGQGDAEKQAEEALRLLEPWDTSMRIAALNTLGRSQEDKGKYTEAIKTLRMTYNESRRLGYSFLTTLTLMNLGTSLNGMGSRLEGALLFKQYIDGMIEKYGKPLPYIGVIYVGMAGLLYENNELEKAKLYMDEGSGLCQSIFYNWIENKGIIESRILFALGEKEAAIDTIKRSLDATADHDISEMRILNTAALAELLLRSGKLEEAKQYGDKLRIYMESKSSIACREAYLPYARLLIYQERNEEALALLSSLEPQIEITLKGKDVITFYILYSKVHYTAGDHQKAGFYFERAVSLAEPQGYLRLFLDEEPIIKDIICSGKIAQGAFADKLAEVMKAPEPPLHMQKKTDGEYIEELSRRETEILELLAKGMSNDEIAKKLYISVNTAQWHISHIYSKLGVKSRTQAILKAKELEIL
jgi:LuxR family maltose regulon positive regulatory protein